MSDFPRMIYQAGSQEEMHGDRYDYMIVGDQDALDVMMANGWYMTTTEAREASNKAVMPSAADSELVRDELESRASELGIKFDGRTTSRKLNTLIIEKLGNP